MIKNYFSVFFFLKNIIRLIFFAIIIFFTTSSSFAQSEIALYSGLSTPTSTSASNSSATSLSRGTGITINSGSSFNSKGFTTTNVASDAITNNDYVEWTITANSGYTVTVSKIEIDYDRSNSGPSKVFIRTNLDTYSSDIYSDSSVSASGEENTITGLSLTSSDGGSITFRLYGYNASSSGGTFDIEDDLSPSELSLTGTGIILSGSVNSSSTTWTGSSGTDWNTSGNWSNGIPTSSSDASIPDVANAPIISSSTGAQVNNLTITESEGITINSGGSIIVSGTSSGNITYNRTLSTTNWYLISSPVVGQDIDAFVSAEGLDSGEGNNLGLSDYSNSTPGWTYYQNGASGTGNFTSGDGRAIKLNSTGDIAFTGTIDVNNAGVGIGISTNTNGFNLIGNPYPSFIAANTNADGTNNILTINTSKLTENTLWFWNQSTNSYDQINHASSARHIAPGQGFFVSSNGSNTFSFTEAMQSHQGTDTFQRPSTRPEIELTMTNGSDTRNTDIFYIEGTTTGWDNGYDSSIFEGFANEFAIYTHAVENGTGRNLGIQSLPPDNFENMVIPIGVNAISGTNISIDASITNFLEGMNVYLEDKEDDSFTLLDGDANFTTTLASDLNGIGRFYLHTTTGSLSADDLSTNNNISIYNSSRENLRIVGVQNGTAKVQLYNILGKEVFSSAFEGAGANDIQLPSLAEGLYIVNLSTANGKTNKKIIIQ